MSNAVKLSEREKAIRLKLRDDFEHYASRCLRIRTKDGMLKTFELNEAQRYVHQKLEHQLKEKGCVRAIVLKGRQQGMCYAPNMRVLTSDYKWVNISDVRAGDKLFSVDEYGIGESKIGRTSERRIRIATVEETVTLKRKVYEVTLENGTKLIVTGEHRHLCRKRGGTDAEWRTVNDCKEGDYIRAFCSAPCQGIFPYEDGWFGGLLDGEGSFGAYPAARISVTQVKGDVLTRAKKYLESINVPYYELIDKRDSGVSSKLGDREVHCLRIVRHADIIKILSLTQPIRFINKQIFENRKLPKSGNGFKAWQKIISIAPLPEQEVIDLQTSTKTFICEGIVSHNSTYTEGRFFWKVTHRKGVRAFILTHDAEATANLFDMAFRYYNNCPELVRPHCDIENSRELYFDKLDSGYKVGTAGNKGVGRSSTIQYFHGSEVSAWPHAEEHAKGILQAVPQGGASEIILESTAKGVGNYFYQQWQAAERGENDFEPIFIPWFWQKEYRRETDEDFILTDDEHSLKETYKLDDEQLNWRRYKISELTDSFTDGVTNFRQEYPCDAVEAFAMSASQALILPQYVREARKEKHLEAVGPLVIGVDIARYGNDKTAIVRRRGRVAWGLEIYSNRDLMSTVGRVKTIIDQENPGKVFLDMAGMGVGVYDRLVEMGYSDKVEGVNGGFSALDDRRFYNKRAEMWGLLAEWLYEGNVVIPDSDVLYSDLCAQQKDHTSNNQLKLISKKELNLPSPDAGDALALTFAMPVGENHSSIVDKINTALQSKHWMG